MLFRLSQKRLLPPKSPRNQFFPWHNFSIQRTGVYLEANKISFRVPVTLTKFEIKEYLRKIYGVKVVRVATLIKLPKIKRNLGHYMKTYYKAGAMYKKAIVTTEEVIPDEVKMIQSAKNPMRNPDIIKYNNQRGHQRRRTPTHMLVKRMRGAWNLELPNLLAADHHQLNPKLSIDENENQMLPDPTKPFAHWGLPQKLFSRRLKLEHPELPPQKFQMTNLAPWRQYFDKMRKTGSLAPPGASPGTPDPTANKPAHVREGSMGMLTSNKKFKRPTPSPFRKIG